MSDFDIYIWNCSGGSEGSVTSDIRNKAIKNIITWISKGTRQGLLLLTEVGTQKLQDLIAEKCKSKRNREVLVHALHYRNEFEYIEHSVDMGLELGRIDHAVLTLNNEKILTVSWHGEHKLNIEGKQEAFNGMLQILKKIQEQEQCHSVIVGGDFNLESDIAKQSLTLKSYKGEVYDQYPLPDYRNGNCVDYVILWPSENFMLYHGIKILQTLEKRLFPEVPDIFEHPLVKLTVRLRHEGHEHVLDIYSWNGSGRMGLTDGTRKKAVGKIIKRITEKSLRGIVILTDFKLKFQEVIASKCLSPSNNRELATVHALKSIAYKLERIDEATIRDEIEKNELNNVEPYLAELDCAMLTFEKQGLLVVAWRGPNNQDMNDSTCILDSMLRLVKVIQEQKRCKSVLVGGHFNLSSNFSKESEILKRYQGKVFHELIVWPRDHFELQGNIEIVQDMEKKLFKVPEIFDHPILKFSMRHSMDARRLKDSEP